MDLRRAAIRIIIFVFFISNWSPSTSLIKPLIPPEYQLVNNLLDGYVASVTPKIYSNESVDVIVGYSVSALSSMIEKEQTISIVGWFYLSWTDELLVWDPSLYNNVETVLIPSDKIWLPDIKVINSVDKLFYDLSSFYALVDYHGSVIFQPGGPLSLNCIFNLIYYPFDEQICKILTGAWSTAEDKMKLIVDKLYTDKQIENGEWRLIDSKQIATSLSYPGGNYSMVTFTLRLRRKPQYQIVNVVLPVVSLPLLNLAVFHLPAECGERVSLSITILLAFSVWLLMMSSITPSSSENMPIVAVCTVIFMTLSTISVLITVAVVRLHLKEEPRILPAWVRKILRYFRRQSTAPSNQVQPNGDKSDSDDNLTWKDVATAVDRIAFYGFLVIITTTIVVASGAIMAGAPRQSSHF